jgi:hypothetical protein
MTSCCDVTDDSSNLVFCLKPWRIFSVNHASFACSQLSPLSSPLTFADPTVTGESKQQQRQHDLFYGNNKNKISKATNLPFRFSHYKK